jgi:aubergine
MILKFTNLLISGYITSIRQHEHNILVCCEVSHKVMRQETIYDIFRGHYDSRDRNPNWKDNFNREIIGSTVLTKYNNNTYQISDVDYEATPMSTFDKKGTPTSFYDYYTQRYKIDIRDRRQPLLISKPKARDIRDGRDTPIILIPELCESIHLTL